MKNGRKSYLRSGGICATLFLGMSFNMASGQVATVAAGGEATGAGGSVSYTVGQMLYSTNIESNGSENQGVQQIGVENALPVTLVSFDVRSKGSEGVLLRWVTSMEIDNDYFIVERSMDGRNFKELTKVKGKGSIRGESNYESTDNFPNPGNNYYRLKQVDFDGSFAYSRIRVVNVNNPNIQLTVYPNPVANYLNLSISGLRSENITFLLSTVKGEVLKGKKIYGDKSVVDMSNLPSSVYLVSVLDDGNLVRTFKVVKD